jgi:hypothetical protein
MYKKHLSSSLLVLFVVLLFSCKKEETPKASMSVFATGLNNP